MAEKSEPTFAAEQGPLNPTLWDRYVISLQQRPVLTKACTSASLNALQEIIATHVAKEDMSKAYEKASKLAAYGFFISAPMGHYLYSWLDKAFERKTGAFNSLSKLLVTNFGIAPIQNFTYLFAMSFIAGGSMKKALLSARQSLLSVMKVTWMVFPAVQIFAFKYLPQHMWLPFFNIISFVFGTYINTKNKLARNRKPIGPPSSSTKAIASGLAGPGGSLAPDGTINLKKD